jgi:multidrug resistance protein
LSEAEQSGATDPFEAPGAKNRALFTVAFTLFLDLMGFGIILPVLPYFAEHYGASATAVTLLSTTFSLAQFVMAPVLGRISDRFGRRPVMLISIAGSMLAALTLGLAGALWVIFFARLVAGVSKANVSTAHAYVADLVEPRERAKHMGRMGAAIGLGFIFGPGIGGLLSIESMPHLPFFVSAGLSGINLLMAWLWLPETRGRSRGKPHAKAATVGDGIPHESGGGHTRVAAWRLPALIASLRGTPMLWLLGIAFLFYISFASLESTMALYNEALLDWGAAETGGFITYIGVIIVVTQGLVIGIAVRRMGEAKTLVFGLVSLAIGLSVLASPSFDLGIPLEVNGKVAVATFVAYGIGGLLTAGGNGLVNASMSALVSRLSSADEQGWNMGLKESASALARILGPVMAGPLFQFVHIGAPMLVGGVVAFANLFVAIGLARRVKTRLSGRDMDPSGPPARQVPARDLDQG